MERNERSPLGWAQLIAEQLTGEWSASDGPSSYSATLTGPDGESLFVNIGWRNEEPKLAISASFNGLKEHIPYKAKKSHDIGVSKAKSPATVAREIERRLLPDYRVILGQARERKANHDESERITSELLDQFVDILGGRLYQHDRSNTAHFGDYNNGGKIQILSDDVQFEIRLPRARALEMASAVAALVAKGVDA
jgi:hypothetical protein